MVPPCFNGSCIARRTPEHSIDERRWRDNRALRERQLVLIALPT